MKTFPIPRTRRLPLAVTLAMFTCAASLAAQEPAAAAEPSTRSLIEVYLLGGWAMWPLTLLSVLGVGLVIYNAMAIRPASLLQPHVAEQLKPALEALDFDQARQICEASPGPVANIFHAGLERLDPEEFDPAAMEKAMEESSAAELAGPYVFISYLSTIANISPMMGLLGTVSGMIKAFDTIAKEGMGKPELLANNISEALVTTASGLIIAIPAMIAYLWFKNRFNKIASGVGETVGNLQHLLLKSVKRSLRGS